MALLAEVIVGDANRDLTLRIHHYVSIDALFR